MKTLDEFRWIYGGGLSPEWEWVVRRRREIALADLARVEKEYLASAPPGVRKRRYAAGLRYFLRTKGPERDRLAVHPCFDYWLDLHAKHFKNPAADSDWHLQFGLFQGFAASLALARGDRLELDATADPDGRFFLYGSPKFVASKPTAELTMKAEGGRLVACGKPVKLEPLVEAVPGITADDRGWLLVHGVTMHGLVSLEAAERERFAAVLKQAFSDLAERDPGLHAEMTDMVFALVPLKNPVEHGSVSSSYVNLRGAIALSHAEDPILQAETLIHEFCHQKMNQLLVVDPVLLPGQSGQVFYSPWRADARRLRGLLLGAHAFLNVARYLATSLERESLPDLQKIELMVNVSLRLNQVEAAMKALTGYGSFTEFGRRFVMGMWREVELLRHATLWYPPALRAEQAKVSAAHRKKYALGETGFHKSAAHVDKIRRTPFLGPQDEEPKEAA
ncbi:MAG: HEXXH motif-containing putative peptide modification protein [Elusimicrobiota bacterium]|nr:MAG: HEXXH motif-containing putative peptide modification protein [Elusimicrobiota bacterium]